MTKLQIELLKKLGKRKFIRVKIPYFNRVYKKAQNYYPLLIVDKGQFCLVDAVLYESTIHPDESASKYKKTHYIISVDKWKAAKKYAAEHYVKFKIYTFN